MSRAFLGALQANVRARDLSRFERERAMFGNEIWPAGLAANRSNLERLIMYSRDQSLIRGDFAVDELFAPAARDT